MEIFPVVMASIVIFILFWISGIFTQLLITRLANKRGLNPELLKLIGRTTIIGLIIFGLVMALGTIGINVSALVAGLGLTGFALGFALKDVVSNLIAGSMILLHKPFKVHDIICEAGHEGKVIDIDLRYTTIEADGKKVLIQKSTLFTKEISILN
jgi:small-conductance mechanosensitive channel